MKNWLMYWLGQLKRWLEHKLENEKEREFRKYLKVLEIRWKEAVRKQQADCPHIAGCNPIGDGFRNPQNLTSIAWHQLDTGFQVGVCSNCQRIFQESDADYLEWRRKPSFGRMSAAGVRRPLFFSTGFPQTEMVVSNSPVAFVSAPIRLRLQGDNFEDLPDSVPSNEDLERLSDAEVADLFERTRAYYRDHKADKLMEVENV